MGCFHAALVLAAAGCGRLGFDTVAVAAGSDAASSDSVVVGDAISPDALVSSPIALVQAGPVVAGTTNLMLTLPAPSTAGTLLVAAVATNDVAGVGVPGGWTVAAQNGSGGGCTAVLAIMANNPGGITGGTFTQIAGTPGVGQITEWSSVSTTAALDATGTNVSQNPSAMQLTTTSSATTTPGDLAVTVFCEDVNSPTYVTPNAWTHLGDYSNTSSSPSFTSDYALALPAAVIAEMVTSSLQGKYTGVIATFHPQ